MSAPQNTPTTALTLEQWKKARDAAASDGLIKGILGSMIFLALITLFVIAVTMIINPVVFPVLPIMLILGAIWAIGLYKGGTFMRDVHIKEFERSHSIIDPSNDRAHSRNLEAGLNMGEGNTRSIPPAPSTQKHLFVDQKNANGRNTHGHTTTKPKN